MDEGLEELNVSGKDGDRKSIPGSRFSYRGKRFGERVYSILIHFDSDGMLNVQMFLKNNFILFILF